jgi:hypothetical protein
MRRPRPGASEALAVEGEVGLLSVDGELPPLVDDLLVVDAPTHVHGLSSRLSRKGAPDQQSRDGNGGIGARGWLEALPLLGGSPRASSSAGRPGRWRKATSSARRSGATCSRAR